MIRRTILILLTLSFGFSAFRWYLAYANGALADKALRDQLLSPSCTKVPYVATERKGMCFIVEAEQTARMRF